MKKLSLILASAVWLFGAPGGLAQQPSQVQSKEVPECCKKSNCKCLKSGKVCDRNCNCDCCKKAREAKKTKAPAG